MILIILLSVSLSNAQNINFEVSYPDSGQQTFSDIELLDNDIFAVGYSFNSGYTGQIKRIDTSGNELWSKDILLGGFTNSQIYGIERVQNEPNFYISGYISSTGVNYNFIAKIDSAGDTIWVNKSNEQGFYALTRSMIQLKDKSVYTVGWRQTMTGRDAVVWKIDSIGQTQWKRYYTIGATEGFDLTEMLDGSLVVAGSSDGDNLFLKIGFDGTLISSSVLTGLQSGMLVTSGNTVNPYNQLIGNNFLINGTIPSGNSYIINDQMFLSNNWTIEPNVENLTLNEDSLTFFREFIFGFKTGIYKLDYLNQKLDSLSFTIDNTIRDITSMYRGNDILLVGGAKGTSSNRDYWLAKISGVGKEWVPDRCAYQPPAAGLDFEYNYPVLTLRDTSSGGLKYLDTVYTWQWNTSVGASGTDDSLVVFFDTAFTKTIDIELVIGNWYGCTDTVNQTLVLGETGLEVYKELEVKVFPNPVKDILNVHVDDIQDKVLFSLYDLQGRLQFNQVLQMDKTTISLSEMPKGLYIYDIRSDGQTIPLSNRRGKVIKN